MSDFGGGVGGVRFRAPDAPVVLHSWNLAPNNFSNTAVDLTTIATPISRYPALIIINNSGVASAGAGVGGFITKINDVTRIRGIVEQIGYDPSVSDGEIMMACVVPVKDITVQVTNPSSSGWTLIGNVRLVGIIDSI